MKTEIHPDSLAKLGELSFLRATRLLKATRMFDQVEIYALTNKAGCVDKKESWTPYSEKVSSPFILFNEEKI